MGEKKSKTFTIIVGEDEKELYFRRPDQDDLFEVDKTYRRIYSAAIMDGIMTEVQARRVHAKSGAWTEEHDREVREIAQNIAQFETVLRASNPTDPDALKLAANLNTLRAEMMSRIGDKQELFSNTAEGIATEQKMHTFIQRCCCVSGSDVAFFDNLKSYKEFVADEPDEMSEIHKQAYFYEYRLPEEIAKDWAEIEFVDRLNKEVQKSKAADTALAARQKRSKTKKKVAAKKKTKRKTAKKTGRKTATK